MSRPDIVKLMNQAAAAMKARHPEVASIYLKNAETMAPNDATINFTLGQALLATGNAAQAEREFRSALQHGMSQNKVLPQIYDSMLAENHGRNLLDEFPEPAPADNSSLAADTLRARAFAQVQTAQRDLAVATMDRAVSINRSAQNLTSRAQLAHDSGDDGQANNLLAEALAKEPGNASALTIKVALLQFANRPDQALVVANALVKATDNSPFALLTRAGVYMQLGQDDKALPDLNATLHAVPTLSQGILYKSEILSRKKDIKGAWNLAQTLPTGFLRSRDDIAVAVSQMAIDAGHREIATNILSAAVQAFPNSVNARVNLAIDYVALNEEPHALDTLMPLADGSDPRVMMLLGQIYQKQNNSSEAVKYFEKAKAAQPGGTASNQQVATTNARAGSLDDAVRQYGGLFEKQPDNPQAAGPLIATLELQGNMDAAAKIADRLASAAPKSPYGPLYKGEIFASKGDLDRAISAFSDAVTRDPKFVPAKYDRAVALSARGDTQAASADLQAILAADPKNAMAAVKLAQISTLAGDDNKTLALLKQAAGTNPKDIVSNLALADFYMQQKKPADAMAVITVFLKGSPKNTSAIAMQGNIQLVTGATDQAIQTFRGLEQAYPNSSQIEDLLAGALAKKGDLAAATAAYQKAVQIAPADPLPRTDLIHYLLTVKKDAAALTAARDYASKQPGTVAAQALAGTLVYLMKFDEAESVLSNSQAQNPNSGTLRALSGLVRKRGDSKKADDMLVAWLAKHPDDVNVRTAYAEGQMASNPAVAEQHFGTVLNAQPNNLVALNDLAYLLQDKNPGKALAYAQQAQKLAPNLPAVLDTLGWIKWQMNDHAGAAPLLKQAYANDLQQNITIDKVNPGIIYHLAVVLNGTGQQAEAKKLLVTLQSYKSDFDDRKKALALLASFK
jgi:putative PEP-CTERM system TPR-repeat lipoprotein